ncbi:MAG: sensor histidine kinase, partial [Bacteroidia bacterium]
APKAPHPTLPPPKKPSETPSLPIFVLACMPLFSSPLRKLAQELGIDPSWEALRQYIHTLQQTQSEKQAFLADIAHELKTPLFAIQGYLDTLLNHELTKSQQQYFLEKALENTEKMSALVQDILLLMKFEYGAFELSPTPLRIDTFAQEVLEEFSPLAQKQNLTLMLQTHDCEGFYVEADPSALHRILRNLIENAIFYNKPDGKVILHLHRQGNYLRIAVEDTGIGIPPHEQPKIFDRFYRIEKSRSRQAGGTGLGLAITKQLVEAHKSQLKLYSQVGKGSIFSFDLPIAF